jgi:hypothetical protein
MCALRDGVWANQMLCIKETFPCASSLGKRLTLLSAIGSFQQQALAEIPQVLYLQTAYMPPF